MHPVQVGTKFEGTFEYWTLFNVAWFLGFLAVAVIVVYLLVDAYRNQEYEKVKWIWLGVALVTFPVGPLVWILFYIVKPGVSRAA